MKAREEERRAELARTTLETKVTVGLELAPGAVDVATGIGFLDHLLATLANHALWTLSLRCEGDLVVDDHHVAEDAAIALGAAFAVALGDRNRLARFGEALVPMDDALARAVVDLAERPWAEVSLGLARPSIGALASENAEHAVRSFATSAGICVHLDVVRGRNDHHRAEAAFKALALALSRAARRDSTRETGRTDEASPTAGARTTGSSLKGTLAAGGMT